MFGFEIGSRTSPELVRFIKTLGQHRYVASRLHLIHAFAIEAASIGATDEDNKTLEEAAGWAHRVLDASGIIDLASKDERLYRRATDAELVAVLSTFWARGAEAANAKLTDRLSSIGASVPDLASLPFAEEREEDVFPVLVDAGWELIPLAQLDAVRHKGAIAAFDDFEVARFEEETHVPSIVTLHELPVFGAVELLAAFDEATGETRAPFVLWQQGNETYLDYVLRGILRASKLTELEP